MCSSVARGREGAQAPHWPEKYAKYHVFSAFEANFRSKNENSSPNGIGEQKLWRIFCDLGPQNWSFSFESHLKVGQKKWLNLGRSFFIFFLEIT